jgi:hypothetical protein
MNAINYALSALALIAIILQIRAWRQNDDLRNIAFMFVVTMLLCTNFIVMAINIK